MCGQAAPVVRVDDAAQNATTSDVAAVDRRDRVGNRLSEPQATVRSRRVAGADVLVEHRAEVSS